MKPTHQISLKTHRCVWMDAGVMTYKLCDREFDCERCPLDHVLRKEDRIPHCSAYGLARKLPVARPLPAGAAAETAGLLRPYSSFEIQSDLMYSRNHLWIRWVDPEVSFIGFSDFFAKLLPSDSSIVFAPASAPLKAGEAFAWVYFDGGVLPVPSPVTGSVIRRNEYIARDPKSLPASCQNSVWLASVIADRLEEESAALLTPTEMHPVLSDAIDQLLSRACKRLTSMTGVGLLMNDGGLPVGTLPEALGGAAWASLVKSAICPRDTE